jgi:hypothetical protein
MASGGSIIGSGLIRAHQGEEISPANVVSGSQTTLERISDLFSSGRMGGAAGGQSVTTINAPVTVSVAKMDSKADAKAIADLLSDEFTRKLMFKLRNPLSDTILRDVGYLRG